MKMKDISTKQRLIHVAKKLFSQYNYDYVSTRMIASEANIGQSAIFFHFGSKENLCAAVIDDILKYHKIYYAPIKEKIDQAYNNETMTPELALELLQESVHTQIDIVLDPHNITALGFSVSGYSLPKSITQKLYDDIKNTIEIPMAKLLCTYKNSTDLSGAYTISHAINIALVAFASANSSREIIDDIKNIGSYTDISQIKDMLYQYTVSSLKAAPL